MKKTAVIPIDNRPICYSLIKDILAQDKDIKLFMPQRKLLGGLTSSADTEGIYNFLKNLEKVDILVISLDTIAYGGLVSSRRCNDDFSSIKERITKFKEIIKQKASQVYAFSSIMRISNNNINEEEKEYWAQWGKRIFEFSYYQHKSRKEKSYNCVYNQVPQEILDDYLETRKRNFEINKLYLDWVEDKTLDTLVFSKDDTGQYGLNVEEAEFLGEEIKKRNLNAFIKTGADEIPLTLLARALAKNENIEIEPVYTYPDKTDKISRYEDISAKDCIEGQLNLAGCRVQKGGKINMFVNNFESEQGDYVLGERINALAKPFLPPEGKYFTADISNANGSDKGLIEQMLAYGFDENLLGYCGYNTSANSAGCAILSALIKFLAQKNGTYDEYAFKKLMFIRLLDDWAYQTDIRKYVREGAPDFKEALEAKIADLKIYEEKIAKFLNFDYNNVCYSLPWERSFEVEINVNDIQSDI